MAPIPPLLPSTVRAIYRAYEDANESWDSWGISVGELGTECDRSLWLTFRWASEQEKIDGRKISIFRTGDAWEQRWIDDLGRIGCEVFGEQDRIRLVAGHVRGKIDGRVIGLPEAPVTEHLCEFKSMNAKNFALLQKSGVKDAQPKHHVQCQIGMHALGLDRSLYAVTNKDTDERYTERVEYDLDFCIRLLARAERIIDQHEPPARISEDPEFFKCSWCRHRPTCHFGKLPRNTCRSCIFSTPEMTGDGHWSCARFAKPLSIDEQRAGCPAHLYLPGMVAGEQVDADEDAGTVTYRMADGREWVDGASA